MKELIKNTLKFIKKNPGVIYSFVLIIGIPTIIIASTLYSLSLFEKNFNHLLQTKALLVENVFSAMLDEEKINQEYFKEKIDQLIKENSDLQEIQVIVEDKANLGKYLVLFSSRKDLIGTESHDIKNLLALGTEEGIASLESKKGERFWEVARQIKTGSEERYIIKMKLSLRETDKAFEQSIFRTYVVLILSFLLIILLISNSMRLYRYVFLFNKIKEVDKMKDDFVSMASHELRTPLVALGGYVDLINGSKSSQTLGEREKEYLNKINLSVKRLKELVDDILEVSRLDQNRIPFETKAVPVLEIAQKIISAYEDQAKGKGLRLYLKTELASQETVINADPDRLYQILVNLVGNSIKYTLKGEVKLVLLHDRKNLQISVEDTGIGMTGEEQDQLFQKFQRIRNKETQNIIGTGLGLWITKQLVEKMKGKIDIQSIKGTGTRFILSFPLK